MRRSLLLLAAGWLTPTVACAQIRASDPVLTPEAVVQAHLAAENAHDVDRILATLAQRVELRVPRPGQADTTFVLTGVQMRRTYERAVRNAPHSRFHILERMVSGPIVVTREEATGLPGGAREVGLTVYRVEHGRIVALWILNTEGMTTEQ